MNLEGYGLAPGCNADFVLLDASSTAEAIRLRAPRLAVIKRGKIVSRSGGLESELTLAGRPDRVDYRRRGV